MNGARPSRVRSTTLSAGFDAGHGGRMVSLRDLASGREWLVPPSTGWNETAYGSSFTDRHVHGWDEMVPTIDACTVGGIDLPDHGEVWAVPWRHQPARSAGGLRLEVDCAALPLRLAREVWPQGDDLVLDYDLVNLGARSLPVLWAAHPQFAASAAAQICFAPVPSTVEVVSPPEQSGVIRWSDAQDLAAHLAEGSHLKVRLVDRHRPREVTLRDGRSALSLQWHGDRVRHVAVLWDNAQFSNQRVIAVEPSTAGHDSLAAAMEQPDVTMLAGGDSLTWQLTLSVPGAVPDPESGPVEARPDGQHGATTLGE